MNYASKPFREEDRMVTIELPEETVSDLIIAMKNELEDLTYENERLRKDLDDALDKKFPSGQTDPTTWNNHTKTTQKTTTTTSTRKLSTNGRIGMQLSGYTKNFPNNVKAEVREIKKYHGVRKALAFAKAWKVSPVDAYAQYQITPKA